MFRKVLIANRGAIACRIIRTLRKMGVASVAVYSEADRHSLHVEQADEAVLIGPASAAKSYLSIDAILAAAKSTGAQAIHPGYGFLSENASFAERCAEAGLVFLGPTPQQMRDFGLKHTARSIAADNGVPLLPGTLLLATVEDAVIAAEKIGYPVMLKSTAGGGGIGMRLCDSSTALTEAFEAVQRLSQASFGTGGLFIEKFVSAARHIEVQIFGDGKGGVIALGERDCSTQRRNQKVIEETPAPGLSNATRTQLLAAAVKLGKAVNYQSAGTIEFIYDNATRDFYFLEVNTRLQVEHGVTEAVTGIDLVEWMVQQAAGELPDLASVTVRPQGASIQVRLYAEDPAKDFQPSAGRLLRVAWPHDARVETWVESGTEVTPFYDPMLAKVIVHATDRTQAIAKLSAALSACEIAGIETNLAYLQQVIAGPEFQAGGITTAFLSRFSYQRRAIEVVDAGTQTTIQDHPGRLGYWHVGVPPSGPIDMLAFRLANRLVGNAEDAAGLEIAVTGPKLRFTFQTVIALTGADFGSTLNGERLEPWQAVSVVSGDVLQLGAAPGKGSRAYIAIAGGLQAPLYLGSRSTFILGGFGGTAGRALRPGDVLHVGKSAGVAAGVLAPQMIPQYRNHWEIGALYGPHGAPDFFTEEDIAMFFSTSWKVHYNSDRTGVRLIGPKPQWARKDGGEAGLHPSNIHDNAYAIGTVDFTGDMPVILGPDGPSLGGFVCPATIVHAELWKIGQLKPGDTVRFRPLSFEQAEQMALQLECSIATMIAPLPHLPQEQYESPVLRRIEATPTITYRADGDRYLLVEYGPNVLDLNLRMRVHALEQELRAMRLPGIVDITPGVRSLHIHYDARLRRQALLEAMDHCEKRIPNQDEITAPSRIVHLPLSWDDPATQLAIRKYMQSVRPDAPWCPSNIEFIRRMNGLDSIDDVYKTVFDASYLVLGLGDVYLGAPVATPLNPLHRLVTTKYNPARTWTPENAVGIGGAYLCVYGMEGPGGYQFVGRTVQMWNTFRSTDAFEPGIPWLLRMFDQIRFYPISAAELLDARDAFPRGRFPLRIEPAEFKMKSHQEVLASIAAPVDDFRRKQQAAFIAERERWCEYIEPVDVPVLLQSGDEDVPRGCTGVPSPLTASVWNIAVEQGQRVEAGQRLLVLEAMKMEIAVVAPCNGLVEKLNCASGSLVQAGQHLVMLRQEGQ